MKDLFEDEKRFVSDSDVIYGVVRKKEIAEKVEKILDCEDYISIDEICDELTPARRKMVYAVIELYKRLQERKRNLQQVRTSEDIYRIMYRHMADLHVEECWAVFLNQAAKVIRKVRVSRGGLAATQVDVRVILREALKVEATSLILCHNHPSGNTRPSGDDDRLTTTLHQAAKTLNIRLLDHVIVVQGDYYSYADEGRI